MQTNYSDVYGSVISIGDIISLDGETDFDTTLCGEVVMHKGEFVCFYGQDVLGRDCFDELSTVNKSREIIGNVSTWVFN